MPHVEPFLLFFSLPLLTSVSSFAANAEATCSRNGPKTVSIGGPRTMGGEGIYLPCNVQVRCVAVEEACDVLLPFLGLPATAGSGANARKNCDIML